MAEASPVSVGQSRASVTRLMVPTDANFMGNVFGGVILAEVDRVAYISARRHARVECVTASFDRVDFLAPVQVGEVVTFASSVTYVGRSSMEVAVAIESEGLTEGGRKPVGQAFVTMVGVDESGAPTSVPPLKLETAEERRLFEEGRGRMEARRASRLRPAVHGEPRGA